MLSGSEYDLRRIKGDLKTLLFGERSSNVELARLGIKSLGSSSFFGRSKELTFALILNTRSETILRDRRRTGLEEGPLRRF
jgi:hypothetical protein